MYNLPIKFPFPEHALEVYYFFSGGLYMLSIRPGKLNAYILFLFWYPVYPELKSETGCY